LDSPESCVSNERPAQQIRAHPQEASSDLGAFHRLSTPCDNVHFAQVLNIHSAAEVKHIKRIQDARACRVYHNMDLSLRSRIVHCVRAALKGISLHQGQNYARPRALELFGNGPVLLRETLRRCPQRMWLFRPTPRTFSIHEQILNLADIEAQNYVLCRHFICAPRSLALTYDLARGFRKLGYANQSARDALILTVRLRMATYQLLCKIPTFLWSHTIKISGEGAMTLETWLGRRAEQIPDQIEKIEQTRREWINRSPRRRGVMSIRQRESVPING
jgi:hypothetical protein